MSVRANLAKLAQYYSPDEFKSGVLADLGDLSGIQVLSSQVLVCVYVEPEKTKGGIIRIDTNIEEARWQGKVALILKKGETAFKYDGAYPWEGPKPDVGDWVLFRTADAWDLDVKGIPCRLIESDLVKCIIADPTLIY